MDRFHIRFISRGNLFVNLHIFCVKCMQMDDRYALMNIKLLLFRCDQTECTHKWNNAKWKVREIKITGHFNGLQRSNRLFVRRAIFIPTKICHFVHKYECLYVCTCEIQNHNQNDFQSTIMNNFAFRLLPNEWTMFSVPLNRHAEISVNEVENLSHDLVQTKWRHDKTKRWFSVAALESTKYIRDNFCYKIGETSVAQIFISFRRRWRWARMKSRKLIEQPSSRREWERRTKNYDIWAT